jgi:REP element-mobilizing transposase RayT
MAVRRKIFLPNSIYFITFTILGWKSVFTSDKYCSLVYKWFDYLIDKYQNKIYGYVIMPNHIHLLLKVVETSPNVPLLIQNAKRFLAYQLVELLAQDEEKELLQFFADNARRKSGAKHKLFQDRYDSLLIDTPKFFLEKLNYIHKNPIVPKWNLADNIEDYKHSSASNYIFNKGYYNRIEVMEL